MKKTKDSQAIRFLQSTWDFTNTAMPHSWQRLNHTMRDALFLALEGGFEFHVDDFKLLGPRFNAGRWRGSNIEAFYSLAVKLGHNQAWNAYEAWAGRTPFLVSGKRVCVGMRLCWEKVILVEVTSFNDVDGSFTAVKYGQYPERNIERRFTITHALLKDAKKARTVSLCD